MVKTIRKNSSNVEDLNRSDVSNVGLSNSLPTFSKNASLGCWNWFISQEEGGKWASTAWIRDRFVAKWSSRPSQWTCFIKGWHFAYQPTHRIFVLIFLPARSQHLSNNTGCCWVLRFNLIAWSSAPHTTGTKTFSDVITDSIVTRTGQPLIIDSSTVGGPLTTDVVYKPYNPS